jgi:uncharacterized protein (DUF1015 family)
LKQLEKVFKITDGEAKSPSKKHTCGLYLGKKWYNCEFKKELVDVNDPVKSLDC